MNNNPTFLHRFNNLLQSVYALSAELQIVLCLLFWAIIALVLQIMYLHSEVFSTSISWLTLLLLANGLVSGPIVAVLAAIICIAIISPFGILNFLSYTPVEFFLNALVLLCGAGLGGGIKRLIVDINQRLQIAQNQVEGTELPNYKSTVAYLNELLEAKEGDSKELDVLSVKLQNLDEIRKSSGRARTDELVKEFASILKEKLGQDSYISQPSANDLLGLLLPKQNTKIDIDALLNSVKEEAAARHPEEELSISTSANMQKRSLQGKELDVQQWLDRAIERAVENFNDSSVKHANSPQAVSRPSRDENYPFGKSISSRNLHESIKKGEITVEYLPRLSVYSGYFSALEASLVWQHPKRGVLDLNGILATLDERSALKPLHRWMVHQILKDVAQWFEQGVEFVLCIKGTFEEQMQKRVVDSFLLEMKKHPEHTGWLSLELSESTLSKASDELIESLRYIQQYGGTVIISSYQGKKLALSKVFLLPVDAIKLSPTIVANAVSNSDNRRELGALIKQIHSRGLTVIADGIESSAAIRMLRPYGCDELQGPFLSRSLAKDKIPWGRIRT